MKNLLIKTLVFTLITFCISNTVSAQLDNTIEEKLFATKIALDKAGYEYVTSDTETLKKGKAYLEKFRFNAGYDYVIVGVTEKGVSDLDLYIYDLGGNQLLKNTKANDYGMTYLEFTVNQTDSCYIQANNYDSKRKRKGYLMAIIVAKKPSEYNSFSTNRF